MIYVLTLFSQQNYTLYDFSFELYAWPHSKINLCTFRTLFKQTIQKCQEIVLYDSLYNTNKILTKITFP